MITARCIDCDRTVYLADDDTLTCPVCSAALIGEVSAEPEDRPLGDPASQATG